MALVVNGTTIPTDKPFMTNGSEVHKVVANGTVVWGVSLFNNTSGHFTFVTIELFSSTHKVINVFKDNSNLYHLKVPNDHAVPGYQFTGSDGNQWEIGTYIEPGSSVHKKRYRLDAV